MRWKAAVAMVLLAGLVVGVLWYDAKVSPPAGPDRTKKIFPAFKADLAEEITLERADPGKGKVVLANREGTWRMEQPVACKANNFNVSGLTSAISDCEPEKNTDSVTPGKGEKLDLAKYGLDKPTAEVTVKMKDAAKTVLRFALGAKQGLYEGAYYFKASDQDAVHVVGKRLAEELLRDADGYRDRKLFDMTAGDVDSLELDVGKGPVAARREAEDQWRLTAPVSDRGNRTKLEGLRDKLLDRDLDEFDHEAIDPAKQGFDKPSMRLVLSSQRAGKRQEVLVGKVVEGHPHLVYARRADLPFLYRIQKKNLDELQPTVNELRDTYLETFSADKLAGFIARDPAGAELILERDGESWRMTKPKEAPADKGAVEDMSSKLSSLEIKAFVEDAPKDLARFGLGDKPDLALVIKLRTEPPVDEKKDEKKPEEKKAPEIKTLGELLFGKICPAGTVAGADAAGRFRYAKRAADPGVFAVPAEAVDRLLGGALALRDRTVVKVANKDKIIRLAVTRGELKYAAEKKEGKWMLTSPVGEEADSGAAVRLVDRLAELTAEKVAADGVRGKAIAEYGLDKPSATLELAVDTGADPKVHRVLLGKASSNGGTYAMAADADVVYELARGTVDDLSGELVRRDLLDFDKAKAQKITVTRKRGELVLARTGQGWSLEQPAPAAPAEGAKVDALLAALAGLKAERIADYAPGPVGKYGLVKPATTVTVEIEGGKAAVLHIGDGLESGARRYAKVPDRAPAFVVDKSVAEKLEAPADDFKKKKEDKPPTTVAPGGEKTAGALPRVRIKTDRGDIVAELFEDDAPNTVANFISLAEGGKYDGLTFHRVAKGFMIQGGCPRGDGRGDMGYRFADEIAGRTNNKVATGTLCMANSGPDTNGSQFFIMTGPERPDLSLRHTVFGKVVEGLQVAEAISAEKVTGPDRDRPVTPVKMLKVEVLNKRDHPYEVKKL